MAQAKPRILIYVQHLLGVGHFARAGRIARALAEQAFDVTLVSGGAPVSDFNIGSAKLIQLLPLRAPDTRYAELTTLDGRAPTEREKRIRRDQLLSALSSIKPSALVVEHYPFGRRKFGFELEPLLDVARAMNPRPKVICSVRDILVLPRNKNRVGEMIATLNANFDAVFVHGDPNVFLLTDQVPALRSYAGPILYTGYIAPAVKPPRRRNRDIVFSLGSGLFGEQLINLGVAASKISRLHKTHRWRFFAAAAASHMPPNGAIEKWSPELASVIASSALSVSQGGYNTVTETLASDTRAIIVPFDEDGQTEQRDRAQILEKLRLVRMLTRQEITPHLLAETIDASITSPLAPAVRPNFDGLNQTCSAIADILKTG